MGFRNNSGWDLILQLKTINVFEVLQTCLSIQYFRNNLRICRRTSIFLSNHIYSLKTLHMPVIPQMFVDPGTLMSSTYIYSKYAAQKLFTVQTQYPCYDKYWYCLVFFLSTDMYREGRQSISSNEQTAAFYAYLSHTETYPGHHHIIVFDKVITNTGAYNTYSGIFVAPSTGMYVFLFYIHYPKFKNVR